MAAKKKSDLVKVELLVNTIGHSAGDLIEVEPEVAESLILNRNARGVDDAMKALEADILGTADEPTEG